MRRAFNPVTGAFLREIGTRFGSLTAKDSSLRRDFFREVARDAKEDVKARAKARTLAKRQEEPARGRPRTYDLALVAKTYVEAVTRESPHPAPLRAVADATGTTRPYASALVDRAIKEGYLDPKYRRPRKGDRS